MVTIVIDEKTLTSVIVTVLLILFACLIMYIFILKCDMERLKDDKDILERIYQNKIEHLEEVNAELRKENDYYNARYTITGDVTLPDGTVSSKETYDKEY